MGKTLILTRERPPSYQIKEGDSINIDVTSPGATLALGMLYWRSNNTAVASWMDAPDTSFLLEFVRPDLLLLRTLAKGLILWDSVTPSLAWVEAQVGRGGRGLYNWGPKTSTWPSGRQGWWFYY